LEKENPECVVISPAKKQKTKKKQCFAIMGNTLFEGVCIRLS